MSFDTYPGWEIDFFDFISDTVNCLASIVKNEEKLSRKEFQSVSIYLKRLFWKIDDPPRIYERVFITVRSNIWALYKDYGVWLWERDFGNINRSYEFAHLEDKYRKNMKFQEEVIKYVINPLQERIAKAKHRYF